VTLKKKIRALLAPPNIAVDMGEYRLVADRTGHFAAKNALSR
jgi:hypothetical protein